ncbi:MAG: DUF2142 domain-containing protein, partial [Selenomonadaceae bacterium]|nr:DUF2142 domain-containing protein [Selenomonadaceae bacterium]
PRSMTPHDFTMNIATNLHTISFDKIKKFLAAPLNPEQTELHIVPNTGQYSPLAYFPQATAAFFGRILNLNAGIIYYSMGFAALIFAATCIFWAIKFLPEKRALIFLLAMTPIFLTEATSTSADAVIDSVGILATAWLLSLRKKDAPISTQEIFALVILAISLGLLKQVYGTILLLYFLIPRQRFKNFGQFAGLGIFLLALDLAISANWIYFAVEAQGVALFNSFYLGDKGIDIAAQKDFLLQHPQEFLAAFFATIKNPMAWRADTFINLMGYYNLQMSETFGKIYLAAITFAALFGKLNFNTKDRLLIIFAALSTILGIFLTEYLIWTPVGAEMINGVQGRYFVPVALLIFCPLSIFSDFKYEKIFATGAGIFGAANTIWMTYSSFY